MQVVQGELSGGGVHCREGGVGVQLCHQDSIVSDPSVGVLKRRRGPGQCERGRGLSRDSQLLRRSSGSCKEKELCVVLLISTVFSKHHSFQHHNHETSTHLLIV